jgi:hypothetical protein
MKKVVTVFLLVWMTNFVFGQATLDVGITGGAGTYAGDMTKVDLGKSINPAIGAFARYNFNPRYGIRLGLMDGNIGATGEYESNPWEFSKNVLDLSLVFEFNFFRFIVGNKETPYSTYLFGGLGMQMFKYNYDEALLSPVVINWSDYSARGLSSGTVMAPTIPFGIGMKVNLSKKVALGIEGSFRKSLSDKVDDLDDPLYHKYVDTANPNGLPVSYIDEQHNNDWTMYLCFNLVWKLNLSKLDCPVNDKKL